jgi:hypothetical protein
MNPRRVLDFATGWYRVARTSREAHVRASGVERAVMIDDADAAVLDQVDAAYRGPK